MNFEQARFNMVEQQIRPWDVLDFDILDALSDLPRERFVLPEQLGYAYADTALRLPNGGQMLEPKVIARLAQGLKLQKSDTVLEIGTGSGYATALLATLAGRVISVDLDEVQQQRAAAVLAELGITNVEFRVLDGLQGVGEACSAVYVGGACPVMPEQLKQQLADHGRMAVIIGETPMMRATLVERQGDSFKETVMFDTVAPALHSKAVPAPDSFRF